MVFIVLFLAVMLDLLFGEPPAAMHPTVWMGRQIAYMKKLSAKRLTPNRIDLKFIWGVMIVLSGIAFWGGLVFFIDLLIREWRWLSVIITAPLLKVSFSLRYLLSSGKEIRDALLRNDLEEARKLTAWHLVSRNTESLDEKEISSCVIESLSENITDSFSSPVFYYLIAGLPGAWCYRFINTSDAMIAYRTDELEWLGKFTAWCDSFLNLIPARLTGMMVCAAAYLCPGASGRSARTVMMRDRNRTASPNAGWTMAAMAGAVHARLEKKDSYVLAGEMELPSPDKINLCLRVTIAALLLTLSLLILLYGGILWVLNMAA